MPLGEKLDEGEDVNFTSREGRGVIGFEKLNPCSAAYSNGKRGVG